MRELSRKRKRARELIAASHAVQCYLSSMARRGKKVWYIRRLYIYVIDIAYIESISGGTLALAGSLAARARVYCRWEKERDPAGGAGKRHFLGGVQK